MIRDLEDRVSCIHLGDNLLIAGDWSGGLKAWNRDGDLLWSYSGPDRVSSLVSHKMGYLATMGLDLVALDSDGCEMWRHRLEGSADEAMVDGDGIIHATSSVFDIEHGDFMESAHWCFSMDGELQRVERFDERPWFMGREGDVVILGLGRPRCGMLSSTDDGMEWSTLADDDPVSCGIQGRTGVLFGHARGSISKVKQGGVQHVLTHDSGISNIICTPGGFAILDEEKKIYSFDPDGESLGFYQSTSATEVIDSFTPSTGDGAIWSCNERVLVALSTECIPLLRLNMASTITSIAAHRDMICVGLENGQVQTFQREMLVRRMEAEQEQNTSKDSRQSLRDRLRRLRD